MRLLTLKVLEFLASAVFACLLVASMPSLAPAAIGLESMARAGMVTAILFNLFSLYPLASSLFVSMGLRSVKHRLAFSIFAGLFMLVYSEVFALLIIRPWPIEALGVWLAMGLTSFGLTYILWPYHRSRAAPTGSK